MDSKNIVKNQHLLEIKSDVISRLVGTIKDVGSAASCLASDSNPHTAKRAKALLRKLDDFAPSITLIGQVKAGKTALVSAMVGQPGLLPSDVNPWTSVVTELQINKKQNLNNLPARFTFFDRDEWDNLVATGGRLGEMAGRAGAAEEVEKIQQQIIEMRENTEARLGNSFELLLGKAHKYDSYDHELIQRYVCAGDPDEEAEDPGNKQGRFADITKSAELAISVPQFPISMHLRDTPGVNDTFMVREQVTIKSLRGSEICLVVLSAHQALNTADMALIRMISNFENRQVILFVNRIDELADPSKQIPEIRENVAETLKNYSVSQDCEIIFGSARWAEVALSGNLDDMDEDSQNALNSYAKIVPGTDATNSVNDVWELAGIPALMEAIYQRILEGSGARLLDMMGSRLANLYNELKLERGEHKNTKPTGDIVPIEVADLKPELEKLADNNLAKLQVIIDKQRSSLHARLERAQNSFVRRATDALIAHLDRFGEQDTWQYDAMGLRLMFRSAYVQFAATLKKQVAALFAETAGEVEEIYFRSVGFRIDGFKIEAPETPSVPPPVVLARTIALDLSSTWWRRWWQKRKGFQAFASDYSSLIQAEVASLAQELEGEQVSGVFAEIQQTMQSFIQEQSATILKVSDNRGKEPLLLVNNTDEIEIKTALENALTAIERFAA